MKSFIEEFKTFILKGNAMELAIGVIIANAFGKIVSSLVDDIIMPTVGLLGSQNLDFSSYAFLGIKYGAFINNLINLIIVGFAIFATIKLLNKITKKNIQN